MEVETTVDVLQWRYYRLNKMFMKLLGQWPYQSTRIRIVIVGFIFLIILTYSLPVLVATAKNLDDFNVVVNGCVGLIFIIFCITKQLTLVTKTQKIRLLLHRICTDWEVLAQDCDLDILHEYAEKGRIVTIVDAILTCITSTLYVMQPMIPKIVDVLLGNGTKPGRFPVPISYYNIDMQKNYFYIILHSFMTVSLGYLTSMSFNCIFVVNIQHNCGLFAMLGRKLQRFRKYQRSRESGKIMRGLINPDANLKQLVWCINRHRDAIEYAEIIEATYSWCLFIVMGTYVFMMSLAGIQIFKRTANVQKTVRYITGLILSLGHIFVMNYMSQRLMDHSVNVHHSIINSEWYELPVKTQKLLLFMMMRSSVACQLTAGKVFILSTETFTVILKTSVSYFTVLNSVLKRSDQINIG